MNILALVLLMQRPTEYTSDNNSVGVDGRNEWPGGQGSWQRLWHQCDDEADFAGGVEGSYSARGSTLVQNTRLSVSPVFV